MKTILYICALLCCTTTWAGPGHSHTSPGGHMHAEAENPEKQSNHGHAHGAKILNIDEAKTAGQFNLERLVKINKIDKSWLKASFEMAEQKKFGKKNEWLVTFNNEQGVKGKKLYIFLKPNGEFVAANFTGK